MTCSDDQRQIRPASTSESVFFDPWLTAKGDAIKSLSETIVENIERKISTGMTRQARGSAIVRRRLVVENMTANIVSLALSPHVVPGSHLAVATAKTKTTRYDREDYPKRILSGVLEAMEAEGFLVRHAYVYQERNTTVEPTVDLMSAIRRHGVRLGDIGREPGGETIWLVARTGEMDFKDHSPMKRLVHYADTAETIAMRREMERINDFINQADFRFDGEAQVPVELCRAFLLRSDEAPHAFNLNGRLIKGWWQHLKSTRRHLITIGGEQIADIDYQSCYPNLAYLLLTGRIYQGDPYDIPGLEGHRDAAKLAMLNLLSRTNDMRRLSSQLKLALPPGWTARRLVEAFSRYHPELANAWGRDIGVELMATESKIMAALLLELESLKIAAMGLHDGIQVAVSKKHTAMQVMADVSERLLGVVLPVKEKPVWRPGCRLDAA